MENKDRKLLIEELCAKFPYGIMVQIKGKDKGIVQLSSVISASVGTFSTCKYVGYLYNGHYNYEEVENVMPCLFPLSSMTDEQRKEFSNLSHWVNVYKVEGECAGSYVTVVKCRELIDQYGEEVSASTSLKDYIPCIEWLNKNHFDYRGLIEKGLAIDATNLNIY